MELINCNLLIRYRDVAYSGIYSLDLSLVKYFMNKAFLTPFYTFKTFPFMKKTTENRILFFLKIFYFFWSLEMIS